MGIHYKTIKEAFLELSFRVTELEKEIIELKKTQKETESN